MMKEENQPGNHSAVYTHQLVTIADLERFKNQMLQEIRRMLPGSTGQSSKQWLKSREVRKLLDISPGKLHALRINRQLSFMRVGGTIYYDRADIEKMFEKFKVSAAK